VRYTLGARYLLKNTVLPVYYYYMPETNCVNYGFTAA
jgi:hypothetical protein